MEGALMLGNGQVYKGHWFSEPKTITEEVIFFTGMTRFQEFITDPLAKGKIVIATYPGIFNEKADEKRFESGTIQIGGLITQQEPSGEWLNHFQNAGVPILLSEDTRAMIKNRKDIGELPAVISCGKENKATVPAKEETSVPVTINTKGSSHLLLIDFGASRSLLRFLEEEGYKVTVVKPASAFEQAKALSPDGIIFSGGPGRPEEHSAFSKMFGEIAKSAPTIAFGLGAQLIASAFGAKIEKLATGHRGFAQPVVEQESNKVFMTKQNHLFSLKENAMKPSGLLVTYRNVQDQTIEGYKHERYPIQGFQFHIDRAEKSLAKRMFSDFSNQIKERKGATVYA